MKNGEKNEEIRGIREDQKYLTMRQIKYSGDRDMARQRPGREVFSEQFFLYEDEKNLVVYFHFL